MWQGRLKCRQLKRINNCYMKLTSRDSDLNVGLCVSFSGNMLNYDTRDFIFLIAIRLKNLHTTLIRNPTV